MKFLGLFLIFLLPLTSATAAEDFSGAQKALRTQISGVWDNHKRLECMSGQKPKEVTSATLTLQALPNRERLSDDLRILADKAVNSLRCTEGKWDGDPLFTSSYVFQVNRMETEMLQEALSGKGSAGTVFASGFGSTLPYILFQMANYDLFKEGEHFTLNGLFKLDSNVNAEAVDVCGAVQSFAIQNFMPSYFKREFKREYFVQFTGDTFQLFFVEDLLCPKDVTMMTLTKKGPLNGF